MSLLRDDGYMVSRNNRRLFSLSTVPGQWNNRVRFATRNFVFGPEGLVEGVIFVASYGYDRIWTGAAESVGTSLQPPSIDELMKRNRKQELRAFEELCTDIYQKRVFSSQRQPRWLLVLVSKADLWWPVRGAVEDYYLPGRPGEFAVLVDDLVDRLGTIAFSSHVLPAAPAALAYEFESSSVTLSVPSTLATDACEASMDCVAETLEALVG
jgi:hypothetical protein